MRQKEIEILTDEEIERIFATMNVDTVLGARNTAIYSLMLDTGLRLTEVVTLKYADVHLDAKYIKALGKGDKERVVAFGTNCQRALTNYATRYRFENEGQVVDTFFLSIDGHCLSPLALRSLTQRLSKASGVPRLHPHLMRHTYATRFLLNGGNVFMLQQNLGHTTLDMVQKYVHIADRMASQVNQDFSPLDASECKRLGAFGTASTATTGRVGYTPTRAGPEGVEPKKGTPPRSDDLRWTGVSSKGTFRHDPATGRRWRPEEDY